jgi:hypothetical protein
MPALDFGLDPTRELRPWGRGINNARIVHTIVTAAYFTGLEWMDMLDQDYVAALAKSDTLQSIRVDIDCWQRSLPTHRSVGA